MYSFVRARGEKEDKPFSPSSLYGPMEAHTAFISVEERGGLVAVGGRGEKFMILAMKPSSACLVGTEGEAREECDAGIRTAAAAAAACGGGGGGYHIESVGRHNFVQSSPSSLANTISIFQEKGRSFWHCRRIFFTAGNIGLRRISAGFGCGCWRERSSFCPCGRKKKILHFFRLRRRPLCGSGVEIDNSNIPVWLIFESCPLYRVPLRFLP